MGLPGDEQGSFFNEPIILLIEEVSGDWQQRESHWILHYRQAGCSLTNSTDGGEGTPGLILTEEHRKAISDSLTGKKRGSYREGTGDKIRAALKGRKPSEEELKNKREAMARPEVREKMSAWQRGRKLSESHRMNSAKGHCGLVQTDQHKENSRQGILDYWKDRKGKSPGHARKLCVADVIEIRRRHFQEKQSGSQLAAEFGISTSLVYQICLGQAWAHVREGLPEKESKA